MTQNSTPDNNTADAPESQSADTSTAAPKSAAAAELLKITRSSLNPKWSLKIIVIALAMFALGVWGLIDAMIVYPNRGAAAAEFSEYQRLLDLKQNGRLANDIASVKEPAQDLSKLQETVKDTSRLTPGEKATLEWLTQLKNIYKLSPENTTYPRTDFRKENSSQIAVGSADERLEQLNKKFVTPEGATIKSPSPLSSFDLLTQWGITVAGFAIGLYMVWIYITAKSKTFQWDPTTHTLTLPNGVTLRPSDIAEFDKSKWDKLFIHLHIKPEHTELGGKALELDLLRYVPVEAWVLEMERISGRASPAE